jgi:isoquinoline 1-oxidoreductase alpha subunit
MIKLTVNGKTHDLDVEDDTPLLWVIRDEVGLTGTKFGCGVGASGASTGQGR